MCCSCALASHSTIHKGNKEPTDKPSNLIMEDDETVPVTQTTECLENIPNSLFLKLIGSDTATV